MITEKVIQINDDPDNAISVATDSKEPGRIEVSRKHPNLDWTLWFTITRDGKNIHFMPRARVTQISVREELDGVVTGTELDEWLKLKYDWRDDITLKRVVSKIR